MDVLTFTVELLKATAWPATTIVLAIVFRTELRALLSRLRKGKLGSAEFEFAETVKELEQTIGEISPPPKVPAVETQLVSLAASNPRVALLTAWMEIEVNLKLLAQKHGIATGQATRNISSLIRSLAKAKLIPDSLVPIFLVIRDLRNQAAHEIDFNPPPDAVLGYLQIVEELKQVLLDAMEKR